MDDMNRTNAAQTDSASQESPITRLIGLLGHDLTRDDLLQALISGCFMNQSPSQALNACNS